VYARCTRQQSRVLSGAAREGRGHKLIKFKLIKFGICGYSWVLHEYSEEICGYSKRFTPKLGGYSCFGDGKGIAGIFSIFSKWSNTFSNTFEYTSGYFGILWNGILWNTLKYILCGTPMKKWNTKGYLLPRISPE